MIVFLVVVCVLAGVGFWFGGRWAVRWIKLQRKEARWFRETDEERKKRGEWWKGLGGGGTGKATPEIHTGLDINSTIGQLLDNPDTRAILDKWIPGFSTNPLVVQARGMTIGVIQPLSGGLITPGQVASTIADLLAIK